MQIIVSSFFFCNLIRIVIFVGKNFYCENFRRHEFFLFSLRTHSEQNVTINNKKGKKNIAAKKNLQTTDIRRVTPSYFQVSILFQGIYDPFEISPFSPSSFYFTWDSFRSPRDREGRDYGSMQINDRSSSMFDQMLKRKLPTSWNDGPVLFIYNRTHLLPFVILFFRNSVILLELELITILINA